MFEAASSFTKNALIHSPGRNHNHSVSWRADHREGDLPASQLQDLPFPLLLFLYIGFLAKLLQNLGKSDA